VRRDRAARSASLSFDRAAAYYDRTRMTAPETVARVTATLEAQLGDRGPCLEVGVGTGQVALPLSAAGVDVVGLDISHAMLERLLEKSGGRSPVPLVVGDATCLPFAGGAFGGAVLRHVLQLVSEYQRAISELARVIRPGGVALVCPGGLTGVARELELLFQRESGVTELRPGLDPADQASVDAAFAHAGFLPRDLPPIPAKGMMTVGEFIDAIEGGMFSWT
jgi:SAM-dependent methyltransferase